MGKICNAVPNDAPSKSTEHYQLPLWQADTLTSWLTTMNYAMTRIDDILHDQALRTSVDGLPDEQIEELVRLSNLTSEMQQDVNTLKETVGNMLISMGNLQTSITDLTSRIQILTTNTVNLDTRMTTIENRMSDLEARVSKLENNQGVTE